MKGSAELVRGIILVAVSIIFIAVLGWRWLRGSRDTPGALITKWIVSALVLAFLVFGLMPTIMEGGGGAMLIPFVAVCGLILAILWTPNITNFLATPFAGIIDGGSDEPDAEPFYSIATAKRKQGKFHEAIVDIRVQLARFPADVTGQMLLAEIQADDLKDLQAAHATIEHFIAQPNHSPKNIAYALNCLADWHLKHAQDVDSARDTIQRICDLFPGTEEALLATQRLSHMGDPDYMLQRGNRPAITLKHGVENVGLLKSHERLKPVEENKEETARKLIEHLEKFPADNEVREQLAVLYAEYYQRVDLAADQLEQIIAQPGQPPKNIAHCLNVLADLHIKYGNDLESARHALARIVELFPTYSIAENARQRMAYLKFESKGHENKEAIKLGAYEQRLGLKRLKNTGAPEDPS